MAKNATIRQRRYDVSHCVGYYLKLNNVYDSDIINLLSTKESKQGYIKQLIREDLARTCSAPNSPVPTSSVPTSSVPVSSVPDLPVPKKQMTVKQILSFLKTQTGSFDGSMYELLNALTNEYMNN